MEGPSGTLIGVVAIGLGGLIGYAAWRDVPVFGPSGILTNAIEHGQLISIPGKKTATSGTGKGYDQYGHPLPVNGQCPSGFLYDPTTKRCLIELG